MVWISFWVYWLQSGFTLSSDYQCLNGYVSCELHRKLHELINIHTVCLSNSHSFYFLFGTMAASLRCETISAWQNCFFCVKTSKWKMSCMRIRGQTLNSMTISFPVWLQANIRFYSLGTHLSLMSSFCSQRTTITNR